MSVVEKFKNEYFNEYFREKDNTYKDDEDLMYAVRKAYFDMAPRTFKKKEKGDESAHVNQDGKEEVLKWLGNTIRDYLNNPKEDFDNWHKEIGKQFCEYFYEKALGEKYEEIHFGKAQKIINMTFKYLYCFNDDNKEQFKNCHIPLDKYVLEWFFEEVSYGNKSFDRTWSNFDYGSRDESGTYIWYQTKIREYFGDNKIPLKEEFEIWYKYKNKEKSILNINNNLFYYATKELSQDAFICWLASYALADADKSDEELVKCANKLIYEFMSRGVDNKNFNCSKIKLMKIEKQVGNIDVLLTVNYDGEEYKIIVEDKIHSSEHSKQLERYKGSMPDDKHLICIYFKTGFQSDWSGVEKAGYHVFDRKDVISLLSECRSDNDILINYREYWNDFENETKNFTEKNFEEWDWRQVNGFYEEMQGLLKNEKLWAGFGYVSNPSGGFWGLWYGDGENIIVDNGLACELYLQVEIGWNYSRGCYDYKLCTKLKNAIDYTDREDEDVEKGDKFVRHVRDELIKTQESYKFSKAKYIRFAKHMTVGIYNYNDGEVLKYDFMKKMILDSVKYYRDLLRKMKENNYT